MPSSSCIESLHGCGGSVKIEALEAEIMKINDFRNIEGSFSAVSKPIFASKCFWKAFLRDLSDLHAYIPLHLMNPIN